MGPLGLLCVGDGYLCGETRGRVAVLSWSCVPRGLSWALLEVLLGLFERDICV